MSATSRARITPPTSAPPPPPPPALQQPKNCVLLNGDNGSNNNHNNNNKNNNNNNNYDEATALNGGSVGVGGVTASMASNLALELCQRAPRTDIEQVVMTPKRKTTNSTVILIERKLVAAINERVHVAGGQHTGIIINKDTLSDGGAHKSAQMPAQLTLEFRVFLVSGNTGKHSQESRTLRFWFRNWLKSDDRQAHVAQDFFKELVSPKDFPRDYVGFIKKIMKLLQHGYDEIQSLEIELRILEQTTAPPSRPLSLDESQLEAPPLTPERVLELIEQAYPSPITPDDLARDYGWTEEDVVRIFKSLQDRNLIKAMEFNTYTRRHHEDKEIKVVKQMPTIASNKQPTIAIISAQYCEKLAVDAMIENKETFVRYTTVDSDSSQLTSSLQHARKKRRFGESNVYTLGNIGAHRIVSTKLPAVGSSREAMTATGNTTTRLLGTFQKVDYVFVVGVAGGVPHYTDYRKHVRLGDVVISYVDKQRALMKNSKEKPYVYVYESGEDVQTYFPINDCLQQIAEGLHSNIDARRPWEQYLKESLQQLMQQAAEIDFKRPAAHTDKLFMNIGRNELIEVTHPVEGGGSGFGTDDDNTDGAGLPRVRLHLGPIGSGRDLVRSDSSRTEFARKYGLLATDVEMGSVLDSIIGNCRESFILVKGISDYKDGLSTRKWQNFAALAAASVVKAIICGMDAPTNV